MSADNPTTSKREQIESTLDIEKLIKGDIEDED